MELLKEEILNLQGWSLFSNIERPHAAIVIRDPLDSVIKGVRYQVIPVKENEDSPRVTSHKFLFETWCYEARGPIHHQTFLSFFLRNRQRYDTKVAKYVEDLRILNRHHKGDERMVFATLKCAASMIDHVNFNEHFDVYHMLKDYGLIKKEDILQSYFSECGREKVSSF